MQSKIIPTNSRRKKVMRMLSFLSMSSNSRSNFFWYSEYNYALHLYLAKKENFSWGFTFEDISLIRVD